MTPFRGRQAGQKWCPPGTSYTGMLLDQKVNKAEEITYIFINIALALIGCILFMGNKLSLGHFFC